MRRGTTECWRSTWSRSPRLVGVTGGLDVPGYGELTEDNLVQQLVGNYDAYYPDAAAQDSLNDALIPAFKDQLFSGGDYAEKAIALSDAAAGRHFALYLRDPELQAGFGALGLDGDLASTPGDYLGVATQNTNASKTDYWQRRSLALDVTLDEDGSSAEPARRRGRQRHPSLPVPRPRSPDRILHPVGRLALGIFLPDGVTVEKTTVPGEPQDLVVRSFR